MKNLNIILLLCSIQILFYLNEAKKCELLPNSDNNKFPEDFKFGVSTAAYQIEGAWNADGKGPSIWDDFTHSHPEMIDDRSNGDVAADSYHRFEQDLAALKELKVNHYRFSIAWPRIMPNGQISSLNKKGIDYYNDVIDKLVINGIEPMVTMFHYDMPLEVEKIGGFTNEKVIEYYINYVDKLFELYGDRVKMWITFNELFDYCIPGYGRGNYPPMLQEAGVLDYKCMDVTLKAHAAAYRLYRSKYHAKQGGKIGLSINSGFYFSKSGDMELVKRRMEFSLGWLAHPIFSKEGNYPPVMLETIAKNSIREGLKESRLKPLTNEEVEYIKGTADFLGVNFYTSRYVEAAKEPVQVQPSWEYDLMVDSVIDAKWKRSITEWLYCVPEGLEGLLNYIKDNYNNIEVMVTECGWSDRGELDDPDRIDFIKAHLQAVLNAKNNGCNVSRYTQWSLIDNFEWQRGYTERFGLYYLNISSENKERVAKNSAHYYRSVIESKTLS